MRKGFTLIELIFAIVIIGVLAAVAVPQFTNLKQSAEVNNLLKMVSDAQSAVPSSAVNFMDLENNTSIELSDILQLEGSNIGYTSHTADHNGSYEINATATSGAIGRITFDAVDRELRTEIDCDNFTDSQSKTKCRETLNVSADQNKSATITW